MCVASKHCKEKSDEMLSDIARHCYEEPAEAAGGGQPASTQCHAFWRCTVILSSRAQLVMPRLHSCVIWCLAVASGITNRKQAPPTSPPCRKILVKGLGKAEGDTRDDRALCIVATLRCAYRGQSRKW